MPRVPSIFEGCQTTLGFDSEMRERGPCEAVACDPTRGATAGWGRGQSEGGCARSGSTLTRTTPPRRPLSPGSSPRTPAERSGAGGRSPRPPLPRGAARAGRAEPCGVGEERGSARRSSAVGMRPRRGGERERQHLPPAKSQVK